MTRPRILVTGATGRTGGAVVSELLAAGYPVRALVRRRDTRSAALQARGVEIAVADMSDAERVSEAMRDVQRAYWLPPYDPAMLTGAVAFAMAARQARLESIVSLTQWLSSPSHPAFLTRQHWLADQLFAMIPGVALTMVTPGFFSDAPYLATIGMAAHLGVFPWFFGGGRSAPPSVADIARVAAAALMDPTRHGGRTYRPTGPRLLSGDDMAAILAGIFGHGVRRAPVPLWLFLKAARLDGNPPALLSVLEHYVEESRRGAFEVGGLSNDVAQVTGRMPESFETVARRLAALPANRRSTANKLRELARFLLLPLAPTPATKRYLRGLHLVSPAVPQYTGESAVWRSEHGLGPAQDAVSQADSGLRHAPSTSAT